MTRRGIADRDQGPPIDGPVPEKVMFGSDEMANLAWAVERRLETPLEVGLDT
jgi:hypothetical protein